MSKLWVVRLLIVVWMVLCVRAGFTSWTDRDVPVRVTVAVSEQHPDGIAPARADYRCPAPLGSGEPAELVSEDLVVVSSDREPCNTFRAGRQVLVYLDVAAAVIAVGLTFAGVRHALRPRRFAVPA